MYNIRGFQIENHRIAAINDYKTIVRRFYNYNRFEIVIQSIYNECNS